MGFYRLLNSVSIAHIFKVNTFFSVTDLNQDLTVHWNIIWLW